MQQVDQVAEDCDWKTTVGLEEIVHVIANILEINLKLVVK